MNDGLDRISIFVISFSILLGFCAVLGLIGYAIHEGNTPDPNKARKIELCAQEERIDVRAMCIALVK